MAWQNAPYSRGAWAEWNASTRRDHYALLLAGDGPVFFAGEHMSYVTERQEGAVRSAHHALALIAERAARAP